MEYIIVSMVVISGLMLLFYKALKSYIIGRWGEYRVAKQLSRLSSREYRVLNNIILKTKRGTTEIDHIVVSRKGIYVIETKNRKGIIYGAENWEYWIQKLYSKEHRFYSPIKQNQAHIEALRNILKKDKINYYSIIVFVKNANIKKINSMTMVISDDQLLTTIRKHKGDSYIKDYKIEKILDSLKRHTVTSIVERNRHKKSVKRKAKLRRKKIDKNICPRCGKKLVKYKSRNGVFYKCTDYPKCKVIIIKS